MPKLKALSAKDTVKILRSFDFEIAGPKGSHIKLRRVLNNIKQTLTTPNHLEMDKGTLKAIFNQASKYISESELKEHFYQE